MKHRSIVVAFGGNALLKETDSGTDREQLRNAEAAARVIADLARRRSVLIVHGNGPQVGNLLIQMEEAALKVPPSTLDTAVALSQGSMGYLLELGLRNQLTRRRLALSVATVLTQVVVEGRAEDLRPTKPVGPFLSRHRARELRRLRGWPMVEDSGRGWRRVVPSPRPIEVIHAPLIRELLASGYIVIAGGGGGIPVRRGPRGRLSGVEAVIDKDFTAALLAREVGASLLVVLTRVSHVSLGFASDRPKPLGVVSAAELRGHLARGEFAEGSMRPKIEAVLSFLEAGGAEALICDAKSLRGALSGRAGTRIYRERVG